MDSHLTIFAVCQDVERKQVDLLYSDLFHKLTGLPDIFFIVVKTRNQRDPEHAFGPVLHLRPISEIPQDQFIGGTVRDEVQAAFRKEPDAAERGEEILRNIHLWKYRDVSPYTLSQGQQRRLGVAALMAYSCEVLVCDEPTYAQDRNNTIAIMEALCLQARKHRIALIFSTHDAEVAATYADEIFLLEGGSLHAADQSVL